MRPAALLLPAIALLIAACSTSPSSPPSASPAPADPTPIVSQPTPAGSPSAPADSPSPAPTATPAPTMTPDEAALVGQLRGDAATDCAPRRTDLPEGALYGIECRPADPLVARVGIYWFASRNEAANAYMNRLASYSIDANEGDCNADRPGDAPWMPGDNEGNVSDPGVFNWENSVLSPARTGCFLDENGAANARATCGEAYIGVLGTGTDLSDLHDWIWRYPEGYEPGTPDSPGICIGDAVVQAQALEYAQASDTP